jgi:excisionase family DNA binding protein
MGEVVFTMNEPKNPFDLLLDRFRAVVAEEIGKALNERRPARLQFTTAEAADMLGVTESWLASKARAGEVPHRQMGHFRLFSLQDIEAIMAQSAVGNGSNGVKK